MKTELLQCRKLTVGLVYVPYLLEHHQVNRIYADVTEKYPYQNMQHLPDGGRMFNSNCDFFVQTTRLQVNENAEYFGASREKIIDLFAIAQARLNVPQFTNFGIKLTAFIPLEGEANAADILERTVLKSVRTDLALLGPGRRGVGLRVVLHKDGAAYEVKIEPFFGDLKQLYVELDLQHPNPFNEIKSIGPKLDAAYEYIFHEVRDFLETLE